MAKAVQPPVVGLKNPQLTLTAFFNKKILLTIVGMCFLFSGYSQGLKYYNTTTVPSDASVLTNWTLDPTGATLVSPPTDFDEGDTFVIRSGSSDTSVSAWEISNSIAIANSQSFVAALDIEGTYTPLSTLDLAADFINDNTFNDNNQTVILEAGADIDGTQSTTFNILTINGINSSTIPLISPTGLVTIKNGGTLNLTEGDFEIGANNTLAFAGAGTINVNPLATTTANFSNPADGTSQFGGHPEVGGTIALNGTSGNIVTVNGPITAYNISTAGGDGDVDLDLQSAGTLINGTMTLTGSNSNLFELTTNSPLWANTSTLFVNNNGQTYTPGGSTRLEWTQASGGTIGLSAGYPNNVTLVNMGTAAGHGAGFDPTGLWAMNGTLSIGNGIIAGHASVEDMSLFTCGGIVINANSSLRGSSFTDEGNWSRLGAGPAIGTYTDVGGGDISFSGNGTPAAPQAITVSSGTENSFANISVGNNTYVKLFSPVTIPATGSVSLSFGRIETSSSHLLIVKNNSTTGITGSNNGYVVGPLQWNMAAAGNYSYPVGTSSGYYPFQITPSIADSATVQAFTAASGGTPDGVTIKSQSVSEYWSLTTLSPLTAGSSVGIQRPQNVNPPYDLIGESLTKTGVYSSRAGTFNGLNGYTNSNNIGAGSNFFFLFGDDQIVTPVRFIDIKASLKNSNEALVQWQVGDQDGIVSYTIEKSTDDINFIGIGSVPATGNISSVLNYGFTDANLTGDAYYKIAAIDQAGNVSYSYVAEIGDASAATLATVTVYPNPSSGSTIGLLTNNVPAGSYAVTLQNSVGQVIYTSELNHSAGVATETITPSSYLQPGTYYLALSNAAGTKFVVTVVVIH